MSRITLPSNVVEFLEQLHTKSELCDAEGRIVGLFVPPEGSSGVPELPPGELERRRQSNKWHTTAEVLAKLKD